MLCFLLHLYLRLVSTFECQCFLFNKCKRTIKNWLVLFFEDLKHRKIKTPQLVDNLAHIYLQVLSYYNP